MKKRLISLLLSVAVLTTSIPVSTFADNPVGQESAATSEENEERGIDYKKNGGTFREGYEAPSEYPATGLPGAEDITKPGYEFGGWYDNPELTGRQLPVWTPTNTLEMWFCMPGGSSGIIRWIFQVKYLWIRILFPSRQHPGGSMRTIRSVWQSIRRTTGS